ncbi:MAG: 50S ribosomal protein L21 [Verrucomicrobia bacterium]|nr:50S ribosomal protein L21 [Verrucomicrobiota bacterium]MDA1085595.1 50S ribosomal protein L21 [Verrucomicrobiota bacterium]
MESYAVIETGGKQYRVKSGDKLQVEHLDIDAGQEVNFEHVLAVSDGKTLNVGTPNVKGVKVYARVIDHLRGPKLVAFKKNRRKGYTRKVGHRQELTTLQIDTIK